MFQGVTSLRSWNRKLWTSLPQKTHWFNCNTWINILCEKSQNYLRGSYIGASTKPTTVKLVRKAETFSVHNFHLWYSTIDWKGTSSSQSFPEEWRLWTTHRASRFFWALSKRVPYCLCWSDVGPDIC